mmetsp:Transcript_6918/g.16941  ORF Transcript_6918/g.16941 Transcript_6918/m.16941 type:complete len:103 (+) Transcript_6918:86-394(+)
MLTKALLQRGHEVELRQIDEASRVVVVDKSGEVLFQGRIRELSRVSHSVTTDPVVDEAVTQIQSKLQEPQSECTALSYAVLHSMWLKATSLCEDPSPCDEGG